MRYYEGVRAIPRFFWKVFGSMYFHFQNQKGWMNDPNGLIYYKGKYHAFFQHYPYAPRWGQMHWGHAVSENLLDWEELDIALCPDEPYENDGGCFSGSAIEKDGRLYLFYTSVSHELGQTQSVAFSDDGITFTKYENNPVIKESPLGSNREFRDPKVFEYEGGYRMVVGAGIDNIGKLLLFNFGISFTPFIVYFNYLLIGAKIINIFFPSKNGFFSKVDTSDKFSTNLFNTSSPILE